MNKLMPAAFFLILSILCSGIGPASSSPLRGYVSHTEVAAYAPSFSPGNSWPSTYEGTWSCVTIVTDSKVATIYPGQKIISAVRFSRNLDGRLLAHWEQPGWTETQSSIVATSGAEGQIDRTNFYVGEGVNGAWAARSRDHLKQIKADLINAESCVDQYIDGQYLGQYKTKSILSRVPNNGKVAQQRR